MADIDFEIGDERFRIAKLNAIQQGHLARRIAPLLPPLVPLFTGLAGKEPTNESLSSLAQPLADALATLTDEAFEYVMNITLSTVKIERKGTYTPFWRNKVVLFEEFDELAKLLPIVVRVIVENLGNFTQAFGTRPSVPSAATA
jgi:hypothetical protein